MAFERIVADQAIMAGVSCIRGTRVPVATIVGLVAEGLTTAEITADFPQLATDDVREALTFPRGDHLAATPCFRAAELARRLDRPERLASAAPALGAGTPLWLDHDHRAVVDLLREALDAAQHRPGVVEPAVLAQLHSRLASWGIWTLPRTTCRRLSDDALDAAHQAGQPGALIAVLVDRGLTPPRRLDDVLISERAGAALLTELDASLDPYVRFLAVCWLADGRLLRGDVIGTSLALADLAGLADECDLVFFRWRVTATRAMTAVLSGDLVTGERLAGRAREIDQDLPGTAIAGVHLCQLLVIRALQGRVGELVSAWEAMAEQTPEIDWRDVLAWVYAANGRTGTARRLLGELDPARFTSECAADPWVHWATNLIGCARACALIGHADLAAAGWATRAEAHRRRAAAAYQRMPAPLFAATIAARR